MNNGEGEGGKKLFIGGLHLDTDKDSLQAYFEKYGTVDDAVVMRDGESRKSRGFGFITFSHPQEANQCLSECPHMVDGKKVCMSGDFGIDEEKGQLEMELALYGKLYWRIGAFAFRNL